MATADVIEIWADSGEVIERDYTPDEKLQRQNQAKEEKERLKQIEDKKLAALAEAKKLGFSDAAIEMIFSRGTGA